MKPIIDRILDFTVSKKLTVFIIATFLVFAQILEADQWMKVALMYIGTQGTIDLFREIFNIWRG